MYDQAQVREKLNTLMTGHKVSSFKVVFDSEEEQEQFISSLSPLAKEIWDAEQFILTTILNHAKPLYNAYTRLVYKDEFGDYVWDDWNNYIDYTYIPDKLLLNQEDEKNDRLSMFASYAINTLCIEILPYSSNMGEPSIDLKDPLSFEKSCTAILKSLGWDARHTGNSGDQGADIIAVKSGQTAVFQCKLWTDLVGNSAVQEIFAAKSFYNADVAIIITNSGYAKSARQLSNSLGIHLLHYSELSKL